MTRKIFYNNWGLRKMKMIPTIWNFRPKQLIMRTFKCYKNIFSFFYTLFKTKKRRFIFNRACEKFFIRVN